MSIKAGKGTAGTSSEDRGSGGTLSSRVSHAGESSEVSPAWLLACRLSRWRSATPGYPLKSAESLFRREASFDTYPGRAAKSQFCWSAASSAAARATLIVVSISRSNGCRKVATTSPSSQVQFDSTKLSERRFSRGSCFANRRCAFRRWARVARGLLWS